MYTGLQPSLRGRMGCAPQLALLLILTLPLGCAAKRVYEEGQTSLKRDSLVSLHTQSHQTQENEESEEEYLSFLPLPSGSSPHRDSLSHHAIPPFIYHRVLRKHQTQHQAQQRTDSLMSRLDKGLKAQSAHRASTSGIGLFTRLRYLLYGFITAILTLMGYLGYQYWRRQR